MTVRQFAISGFGVCALTLVGCGSGEQPAPDALAAPPAAEAVPTVAEAGALACEWAERMPLEGRPSPLDSAVIDLNGVEAKICYGSPSMRGREIFGGLVPHDTLWRTGANEPTTLHLPVAAEVAGMALEAGSYSLYTVPGRDSWEIILNRSTTQWGIESQYTEAVRAQEVGRATVPAGRTDAPIERFTIRAEPAGEGRAELILEWEETRVRVSVRRL